MFQEVMTLAMRNLAIAQRRDKTRFLKVRGGSWDWPKPRIQVGDFVLVKRAVKGGLDVKSHPTILKVVAFRPSGVVIMQGRNGVQIQEQIKNVAPCSLPVKDAGTEPTRYTSNSSVFCRECGGREQEEAILLCDRCQKGYHYWCLTPRLLAIPSGSWVCQEH